MKRVLTNVFAAVFAFCLFTLLPVWAMSETSAFSDGRQEFTDTIRTDNAAVNSGVQIIKTSADIAAKSRSGDTNTFTAAYLSTASDRLQAAQITPGHDYMPVVMMFSDTALILTSPGLVTTDAINFNDFEKPGLKESAVLQRPDLPPNYRCRRNRFESRKSEPNPRRSPDIVFNL